MLATVNPETALEHLAVEHAAVRALIDELSDDEMTRPDTIRYGLYSGQHCSFKDLLAHLITYEALAIEAVAAWRKGRQHWVSDAMQSPGLSRDLHFDGIAQRAHCSLAEVLTEWETVQTNLEDLIGQTSEAEWRERAPYPAEGPTDLGGMIEVIVVAPPRPLYRHLPVHIPDSAAYIDSLRGN
jgi:hypothetical protein